MATKIERHRPAPLAHGGLALAEVRQRHRVIRPRIGVARRLAERRLPALAVATAYLEPDPAISWDDERLVSVREALGSWTAPEA